MPYEPGDNVADYQILSILGAGGMGRVYKVRNRISDRVEAMKILLPNLAENAELGERFMREIKLQATLSHPNIAALHTALHHENQMLMLVEFVDGMPLDALIRSGPIRMEDAVDYMAQVLDALAYAHGKGVIHRDLKPANMMLTNDGVIKLLDFGIAKMAADRTLTKTGFLVGSLPYISPEQIEGAPDIDGRTDIYSLGVTLYQVLTGRVPFQADSEYSLMRKHLQEPPVPPMDLMSGLPRQLNDIVLRALEKDRARRYQTAAEMAASLRSLGAGRPAPGLAPTASLPAQPAPPSVGAQSVQPPPPPSVPPPPAFAPPPQPQPQAYAPYAQPPAALPQEKKFSNRGLYIALGSVFTVVVLVVAATQIPKFIGTSASAPDQGAAQSGPATPVPASTTSQPPPNQPDGAPAQPASQTAEPAPSNVPAPAPSGKPGPSASPQRAQDLQARPPAGSRSAPASSPGSAPATQQAVTSAPAAAAQQPAAQPPASNANAAALGEFREQLMLLGTRVSAVQASLTRLKQEQARMGLGLRGDIAAQAQRMEFYMDEAEAAIKRGDPAAAKKNLDAAERETSKLESYLGR